MVNRFSYAELILDQAGSDKSTLMKFISDHPKTEKVLKQWTSPMKNSLHKLLPLGSGIRVTEVATGTVPDLAIPDLKALSQ